MTTRLPASRSRTEGRPKSYGGQATPRDRAVIALAILMVAIALHPPSVAKLPRRTGVLIAAEGLL